MRDSVDELDIALLDVLHQNPQATFDDISRVLDVSTATVSRRWHRLQAEGRAWVSSAVGPRLSAQAAVFEAECAPGVAAAVATEFARRPHVFSVNITTGQDNVYALVVAADQRLLTELLLESLPAVPGLRCVRAASISALFSGNRWRLGGLSPAQVRAVSAEPSPAVPGHTFDEFDRELFLALQIDGRRGFRGLASAVNRSEPVVRRRVDLLTRSGLLAFRTDFARVQAGWPTAVVITLHVSDAAMDTVGRAVVCHPEIRFCAAIVGGPANLFLTAQLHSLGDLGPFLERLTGVHPGIEVLESRVVLQAVKSWGRLLGSDGRACEVIPVDLWAPAG